MKQISTVNKNKTYEAIKFIIIASLFFSIVNICVKEVNRIPSYEIAFFRTIISLLMSLYSIWRLKLKPWGNNKKYLILRGFFGTISLLLFFYTIQKMPLATAITIQYLSPIFSTIVAIFMLKERTKPIQWIFFCCSFLGILVLKGFDSRVELIYLILGIISAFTSGLAYNCVRKLKDYDHPVITVFYFPLVSLPLIAPYTAFNWVQPMNMDWVYLLLTGILTQLAQIYMTKAYQSEKMSIVSNFSYIGAIFAIISGYLVFHEALYLNTFIGIALIISGAIFSSIYK